MQDKNNQLVPENEHPDFLFRGLSVELDAGSAVPDKEEVSRYVEKVRQGLGERFGPLGRPELKQLPMFEPYIRYFKRFKKSYHLLLQLESFVHKGRSMPFVTPLLTAYFLGELETGVLASAHDAQELAPPLRLLRTDGGEPLTLLSGEKRVAPAGDAALADAKDVVTVVTQGQDRRSALSAGSRRAAWFFYGPPGVAPEQLEEAMEVTAGHLQAMGAEASFYHLSSP